MINTNPMRWDASAFRSLGTRARAHAWKAAKRSPPPPPGSCSVAMLPLASWLNVVVQ